MFSSGLLKAVNDEDNSPHNKLVALSRGNF